VVNVANTTTNQLGIPYHTPYVGSALKQGIPLIPYLIHLYLLECSPINLSGHK
jgi:hypothetical protein